MLYEAGCNAETGGNAAQQDSLPMVPNDGRSSPPSVCCILEPLLFSTVGNEPMLPAYWSMCKFDLIVTILSQVY